MTTFFERTRSRMPHFFYDVDVLEYVPHHKSKSINKLFLNSRHYVLDPTINDLSKIQDNSFRVTMSIDYFQYTPNYLDHFKKLHRISSKFVMFSCAAAGRKPVGREQYYKNLTMPDFYNCLDMDSMFDSYLFDPDYDTSTLYFWGVKRNEV